MEDASNKCKPCPSGSARDCGYKEACMTGVTACWDSSSWDSSTWESIPDASENSHTSLSDATKNGISSTAKATVAVATENPENRFCGGSVEDAAKKCVPCPSGHLLDCGPREACIAGVTACSAAEVGGSVSSSERKLADKEDPLHRFCGKSREDAERKCKLGLGKPCPSGHVMECGEREGCISGVTACSAMGESSSTIQVESEAAMEDPNNRFCGESWEDAAVKCKPCPLGNSGECGAREACIYGVTSCNAEWGKSTSSAHELGVSPSPKHATSIKTLMCENEYCNNADENTPGCKQYKTPLNQCYNGQTLFPGDVSWSALDIYDEMIMRNLKRTFYQSQDGSCAGREDSQRNSAPQPVDGDDSFILPLDDCVGPFGPPRPWGKFSLDGDVKSGE